MAALSKPHYSQLPPKNKAKIPILLLAPGGDFTPTLGDYLNDHVLIGNVILIVAVFLFAGAGWLSTATILGILAGVVATGTIVDTWVHKFFH